MKSLLDFILDGLRNLMKQIIVHKTSLKKLQNEIKLSSKPTSTIKGDKTRVQHRRRGHLQKQNNLASLGDDVGMKVNIFYMF